MSDDVTPASKFQAASGAWLTAHVPPAFIRLRGGLRGQA